MKDLFIQGHKHLDFFLCFLVHIVLFTITLGDILLRPPWWRVLGVIFRLLWWTWVKGEASLSWVPCLKKKKRSTSTCCDLIHASCLTIATFYPSCCHLLLLLLPSLCTLVPGPHVNFQGSRGTSWSPPDSGFFCSRVWPQQKESQALTLVRVVLIWFFFGQFSQMSFLFPDLSCFIICGTKL